MLTPADLYVYAARAQRVVDGDTVMLDVDLGGKVHAYWDCRMRGYDAPGHRTVPGTKATKALSDLLMAADLLVRTHKDENDKYGRYLVEITLPDGRDVATTMVDNGFGLIWDGHGGHPDQPGHE